MLSLGPGTGNEMEEKIPMRRRDFMAGAIAASVKALNASSSYT
jgi:hypothetical protein